MRGRASAAQSLELVIGDSLGMGIVDLPQPLNLKGWGAHLLCFVVAFQRRRDLQLHLVVRHEHTAYILAHRLYPSFDEGIIGRLASVPSGSRDSNGISRSKVHSIRTYYAAGSYGPRPKAFCGFLVRVIAWKR